jgi:phosphoglycolate phosphatase-like HAD superfamily hydrolase
VTHAVLFDLDGTLIDSGKLYAVSYQRAFEEVLDTPPTWEELVARTPTSERLFLLEWLGEETGARVHDAMVRAYTAMAAELFRGPFDGVLEVVDGLSRSGVRLGIVTGKSRAAYDVTARLVPALTTHFEVVVVEDDVPRPKPDPAGIAMALEALGVAPEDAIYVGDLAMDVEAGRRAGTRTAAAAWGRGRFEMPEPPRFLDTPRDLLALLG